MRWATAVLGIAITILMVTTSGQAASTVPPSSAPMPSEVVSPLLTDATPLPPQSNYPALPASTLVSVTLTLENPNSAALERFLSGVEDPSAPSYRHFVSFPEFVQEFSPPASNVAQVEAALHGAGASDTSVAPDRSTVTALLSASSVDTTFGVRLVSFGTQGGVPLYTAEGVASLPAPLAGLVTGVGGLSDTAIADLATSSVSRSLPGEPLPAKASEFVHDNATGNWFVGSDYTQAYGATRLFPGAQSVRNATYPTHVAIATLLGSAFNQSTASNLPPFDPAVIRAYFNSSLGPGWPMPSLTGVPVTLNGVTPPLPGSYGSENDSTLFEIENSLDLEMAGSLAPGSSLYNFYFAGSLLGATASVGDAANYLEADLAEALAHDYAPDHLAAVSCSFGLPDVNNSAWNAELLTAAATGVTILSASGDQGNAPDSLTGRADGQWPIWPATAASENSGAVSVGGVSVALSGTWTSYWNGTSLNLSYDPLAGNLASAATWYDTTGGPGSYAGSEGGVSTVFSEPHWQFDSAAQPAIVNATVREGASTIGRAGPDVAMPANATLATIFANATGTVFFSVLEGTSVAAPVLAGLFADVVAVENNGSSPGWTSLGFVDPEIYRIASFFEAHPGAGGNPFLDVTTGANYVFSAAPGWDPATGWGGINAPGFLAADRNATLSAFNYTGPTPGLPPPAPGPAQGPVPWGFIFAIFAVGVVVAVVLIVVSMRPSRRRSTSAGVPWGAQFGGPMPPTTSLPPPPMAAFPGATFLCPYCGAIRPSSPVRCPRCGAF